MALVLQQSDETTDKENTMIQHNRLSTPCFDRPSSACLALVLLALGSAASAQSKVPSSNALDCIIQPHQVVQVGSASAGLIENILVDRGDMVQRGQPIVQLNASIERATLAVARERAAQVGATRAAAGAQELAKRELERANDLVAENFVSKTYVDKQRAEAQVASGRSDEAEEKRKLSSRELELAIAQLEQRTIRAPIAGVVVERFMSTGEYVEQKPVLRLASVDPLRVDVLVPAAAFGQVTPGMKGMVTPEIFSKNTYAAAVKTVDRVIDAASNTFRVRLELPNPGGTLPAGLRCKVDLGLKLSQPKTSTPVVNPSAMVPVAQQR
jgi:RND family efflux transporter MFP subunit